MIRDSILPKNEYIVYLLRKTNLTLKEIQGLTLSKFYELYKEVVFQESQDIWREQFTVANILSAIYNTVPRKKGSKSFRASDFYSGEMPERNKKVDELETLAKEKNVILPSKELKERK
jgi:hypothetical protein